MTLAAVAETATPAQAEPDENGHLWIGAATVALTVAEAKRADLRGSIRVKEQTRIDVLETYCKGCRRPFEDVAGKRCAAITDPELFHGGPIGQRAKRTGHLIPGHSCVDLGCNTGIALESQRQESARRNGASTDVRKPRPVPAPAEAQRPRNTVAAARQPRLAAVTMAQAPAAAAQQTAPAVVSPDAEARHAAQILASRRGKRRELNPLALTLWLASRRR